MSEIISQELPHETIRVNDALSLRQLRPSEAEYIFSLVDANREYLRKWLPWADGTQSPQDSKNFIEEMIKRRQAGSEYGYAIVLDGSPIGHMSLMHLDDDQEPEIGYWISSNLSGRGITTAAADALTKFGFGTLGLSKIVIKADQKNIASNKVAQKLGYKIERTELSKYTNQTANVWAKYAPAK
ncbi:MAG TPA: GNAT family N-acetyltransferase [Candidatus Saccharimonadales bacterium]|nr:GNAT family N-acetyltransferase [Candidatus Saccharimonadales bacterium]